MKSGKQRRQEIRTLRRERKARKIKQEKLETLARLGTAPCNEENLAPYNSYGMPAFVERGFYRDEEFECIDCGALEIWTATQQKWWYEVAKGNVESRAVRCRPCRRKEQARKRAAREASMEGKRHKEES